LKRHTDDQEALNLCLRARYFWNKRTQKDIEKAIEYYERAAEKDPGYALAHAGLADSYATLPDYSAVSPDEAYPKAKEAALAALEIDDTVAEAHAPLALVMSKYEWDWAGAERDFRRAIELNPSYATAHHWYALHLTWMNRMDDAFVEIERARELDPLSLVINRNFALVCIAAGRRYDEAIALAERSLKYAQAQELRADECATQRVLGAVYLERGDLERAEQLFYQSLDIAHELDDHYEMGKSVLQVGLLLRAKGQPDQADALLSQARVIFEELDARLDLAEVDELVGS